MCVPQRATSAPAAARMFLHLTLLLSLFLLLLLLTQLAYCMQKCMPFFNFSCIRLLFVVATSFVLLRASLPLHSLSPLGKYKIHSFNFAIIRTRAFTYVQQAIRT